MKATFFPCTIKLPISTLHSFHPFCTKFTWEWHGMTSLSSPFSSSCYRTQHRTSSVMCSTSICAFRLVAHWSRAHDQPSLTWSSKAIWPDARARFVIDGPIFFFLAFLRPGSAGVRQGEEKKKSKHQYFFVRVCQIFYSTWNLKWWSGDSPSQVEKEINFFLTFHCTYILKKETRF